MYCYIVLFSVKIFCVWFFAFFYFNLSGNLYTKKHIDIVAKNVRELQERLLIHGLTGNPLTNDNFTVFVFVTNVYSHFGSPAIRVALFFTF